MIRAIVVVYDNDFRSVGLRATNEYEYARLKWLIEDTQNLNNGSKVHLLSHSQGGPLTNLFLTTYVSSAWKSQYIASHIMLSAPLLGSAVSIYAAISGPSYDWIPQFLPHLVVPLIRTFVSILWMWPKVGKQDVWGKETVFVETPLKNYTLENSLSLGIATGIMHVKSKKNIKLNFRNIKKISDKIKINKEKLYEK